MKSFAHPISAHWLDGAAKAPRANSDHGDHREHYDDVNFANRYKLSIINSKDPATKKRFKGTNTLEAWERDRQLIKEGVGPELLEMFKRRCRFISMLQGWFQRAAKRVHAPGGIGYHDTAAHWHALLTHGWNIPPDP